MIDNLIERFFIFEIGYLIRQDILKKWVKVGFPLRRPKLISICYLFISILFNYF